jgi:predicted PurR-regulated permease PerM
VPFVFAVAIAEAPDAFWDLTVEQDELDRKLRLRTTAAAPASQVIARAFAYTALTGLGVLFLWLTLKVDLVIFAGVLLAICLRRAADWLSASTRLPSGWALLVTVLGIVLLCAAIGWFFSESIAGQIDQLSRQLPAAAAKTGNLIGRSGIGKTLMHHLNSGGLKTSPSTVVEGFFGVAANLVEIVAGVVIMLFLGLYFAAEEGAYRRGVLRLVPLRHRARAAQILRETANAIWYWMMARLISMAALGLITTLGLWIIGVPLPVALGFLAGIATFVPYIGAWVSAVPSVLIAAATRRDLAIWVITLYVLVHLTEGYILVPLVQRKVVKKHFRDTLSSQATSWCLWCSARWFTCRRA